MGAPPPPFEWRRSDTWAFLTLDGSVINFVGESLYYDPELCWYIRDEAKPYEVTDAPINEAPQGWPIKEGRVVKYPDFDPDNNVPIFPEVYKLECEGYEITITRQDDDSPGIMEPVITKFYT